MEDIAHFVADLDRVSLWRGLFYDYFNVFWGLLHDFIDVTSLLELGYLVIFLHYFNEGGLKAFHINKRAYPYFIFMIWMREKSPLWTEISAILMSLGLFY